ncbi:MAG: alpha/beta fold hydrolase [Nitrospirales bacterium]|nr:alpha/beta fold hydrolase [Nitrospirales bacterium]
MPFCVNNKLSIVALLVLVIVSCRSTPNEYSPLLETIHRSSPQFIDVVGNNIAYIEDGQGDPLIFIHGFGGSMWNWEYQYKELSAAYHVTVLDLLGSGMSDKPDIPYTPQRLVKFFEGFLDSLNIQRATLIGNSMGAGLAMAMALTSPDRVHALILISGFPSDPRGSVASSHYQQFIDRRPPLWLAKFGNWISGRWATKILLEEIIHDQSLITPVVVERSYQNRHRSDFLPPLYSLMENMEQWDEEYGSRLNTIQHPTLIIWGAEDRVFPPGVGRQLQATIPHSRLQIIPGAGHMPQWEQPAQVNAEITEFLNQNSS